MHDIFDVKIEKEAKALGITRVPAVWVDKPGMKAGFLCAHTTEHWIFKAGVVLVSDLEREPRKDSLHHRSSGLDSTTAKLCAEHKVLIAIDLSLLRSLDPVIMGRTMQNIELCRQHHARMCVISNATRPAELLHTPDVHGLLVTLGMSQGEASATLDALSDRYTAFTKKR